MKILKFECSKIIKNERKTEEIFSKRNATI